MNGRNEGGRNSGRGNNEGRGRQGGGGQGSGRRDAAGRERNRGGTRHYSQSAPSQRSRTADPARLAAFEVLRAVERDDAYANLVLPASIRKHRLDKRDAGFATELAYGALRGLGTYDAILARCVDRPLDQLDPAILDALRLGAHQLLAMRVPAHAALDQTVSLARAVIGAGPGSLINAVLRKVTAHDLSGWTAELTAGETDPVRAAALEHSHPEWIVRALRQSLAAHGRSVDELEDLLAADNAAPVVNLVALPGLGTLDEAVEAGAEPGELVEGSALYAGGDVGRLASVRAGTTRVQDAGSQLVARALAAAGPAAPGERWLDLCAGPGGKAALLAALAAKQGATLLANEVAVHRAELVRKALAPVPADIWEIRTGDGREVGDQYAGQFDRIMVDAPCTGLGALRRRPESRWRRKPSDVAQLGPLQRELLEAAVAAAKPGGLIAYVTCSPHPAETTAVVADLLRRHPGLELLDTSAVLDGVSVPGHLDAGQPGGDTVGRAGGTTTQLWPHRHGTDAMFMALLRRSN
ncbi:MAG: RsmB/NOP family class I SAM-dependent RNA methyltransferase [Actinomycetota bacterium]